MAPSVMVKESSGEGHGCAAHYATSTLCLRALRNHASDEQLCDPLRFLSFEAALAVCEGLRLTSTTLSVLPIWREFFERHQFAMDCCGENSDFLVQLRLRTRFLRTLFYSTRHVPLRWPTDLEQQSEVLPVVVSFVRHMQLVYSTDFLRRHSFDGIKPLFFFQLSSAADTPKLLVLDRNNRGQTHLVERNLIDSTDLLSLHDKKPIASFATENSRNSEVRLLPCKHSPVKSVVAVAVTNPASGTTIEFFMRSKRTFGDWVKESTGSKICIRGGRCDLLDYSVGDTTGRVVVVGTQEEDDTSVVRVIYATSRESCRSIKLEGCIKALALSVNSEQLLVVTSKPNNTPWLQDQLHVWDLKDKVPTFLETKIFGSSVNKMFQKSGRNTPAFLGAILPSRITTVNADNSPSPGCSLFVSSADTLVSLHTTCESFRSRSMGNHTIMLWDCGGEELYSVFALINLPLLIESKPQVHVDANRLIVLGKDHFGMIILVYNVGRAEAKKVNSKLGSQDTSGGVYNLTDIERVQFVNRFRHPAMKDMKEKLQLSCNERFVVVRTKAGQELCAGDNGPSDGLFVLDLAGGVDKEEGECTALTAW